MNNRFARLAALTRGAAVITLSAGAAGAGCAKSDPPASPPTTSATMTPDLDAGAPSDAAPAPAMRRKFPFPNALPGRRIGDGGAGPADGGTNTGP
jgi:hypothetical protein